MIQLKNRDGSSMTIADRTPGDIVVALMPRPRIVLVGAVLGMRIDRRGHRVGDPHGVLLTDVDPETMLRVTRDDQRRGLRRWYGADSEAAVIAIVETVDHRREMQHLSYTRRRLLSESRTLDHGREVDPIRNRANDTTDEIPF